MRMNFFSFNDKNNTSYKYPIAKITVCLVLIILLINRGYIIHIDNKVISIIEGILCTAMVIAFILCIELSIGELMQVYENREKEKKLTKAIIKKCKQYSVDEIVSMVESNDIIEIKIVSGNKSLHIGSSSDCNNGSSTFFDKLYFIGEKTFEEVKDFESELLPYEINGKILVISID